MKIWKRLKQQLFGDALKRQHLSDDDSADLDVEHLRKASGALRSASDASEFEAALAGLLRTAERQCELLKLRANGYPNGPINGAVYFAGTVMTAELAALADELMERGRFVEEERLRSLCTASVCSVNGHYPHLVFPTVLAHGACAERLAQRGLAIHRYRAIVADAVELFDAELEDFEQDGLPEDDERRVALRLVLEAAESLKRLQAELEAEQVRFVNRAERVLQRVVNIGD